MVPTRTHSRTVSARRINISISSQRLRLCRAATNLWRLNFSTSDIRCHAICVCVSAFMFISVRIRKLTWRLATQIIRNWKNTAEQHSVCSLLTKWTGKEKNVNKIHRRLETDPFLADVLALPSLLRTKNENVFGWWCGGCCCSMHICPSNERMNARTHRHTHTCIHEYPQLNANATNVCVARATATALRSCLRLGINSIIIISKHVVVHVETNERTNQKELQFRVSLSIFRIAVAHIYLYYSVVSIIPTRLKMKVCIVRVTKKMNVHFRRRHSQCAWYGQSSDFHFHSIVRPLYESIRTRAHSWGRKSFFFFLLLHFYSHRTISGEQKKTEMRGE